MGWPIKGKSAPNGTGSNQVTEKPKYVLDTNAAIDFLDTNKSTNLFWDSIDEADQFVSVITRIELLAYSEFTPEEEQRTLGFLNDVVVVALGPQVEEEAILIRRQKKLKLPDAVIAATAIVLDAICVSSDPHLLNLSWPGYKAQNIGRE
jgi:predicted nucleic acid-binding protein